jgi:hypothetical protein
VQSINPERCIISIPYGWRSQNPFRSIYFAALAGAAEFSTGLLCQVYLQGRGSISMLVTHLVMQFSKKANSRITFTCEEGKKIGAAVQMAIDTGEGQQVEVTSTGRDENGVEVARMKITWSFKQKRK